MKKRFFTGSYGALHEDSISLCQLDTDNDSISVIFSCDKAEYPSYVLMHPEGKILYAVRELTEEGALQVFSVMEDALEPIGIWPTEGRDPCYLCLNGTADLLLVVNYSGSSFALFRLDESGMPQRMTACVRHEGSGPVASRQEASHPHCGFFAGDRLYITDLGMDTLFCYKVAVDGSVSEISQAAFPGGSGPRHICPGKQDGIMYVNGELASKVFVLKIHEEGAEIIQEISTLPEDFSGENITAAIRLSESGGYLFVTNRGHHSVAAYKILEGGTLELADIAPCGGDWPRDMNIFADRLLIANEKSDLITSLKFDESSGKFKGCSASLHHIKPTCISAV